MVAWARLHRATVVIHQLNTPLWQVHGGSGGSPGTREVHISYHNGDHYNSVRRVGDVGPGPPQRIRLCLSSCDPGDSGQESGQEGSPPRGGLWGTQGSATRVLGRQGGASPGRQAQDKLDNIQAKLKSRNLSNKKRKELKKSKGKIAGEEKRRQERGEEEELVIANIQSLTI